MAGEAGWTVFETGLGLFGIAWTGQGLCRVCLPDSDRAGLSRRAARAAPPGSGPVPIETVRPGWVRGLIADIRRYAAGEACDFSAVPLDLAGVPPFHRAIYRETLKLEFGAVATYGELAARAGSPGAAREVGQAMARNPVPLVIPCHRVLAAGRRLGGFSAPGGGDAKLRMLALEGVRLGPPQPDQACFSF
ncbi:MAG: methylated-DNA--[protein]-cysteine S-methyltransferase [Nitratireductor sp.]